MMNILYSTDENYAAHTFVSLKSLLLCNTHCDLNNIYIISNKLSEKTKKFFKDLVNFYSSSEKIRNLYFLDFMTYKYLVIDATPCSSLSTYRRLFLQEYITEDKVLYIDCDTIIVDSLEELFNTNIDDYAIAGVQDVVDFSKREPLGLLENDRYINAGVSLINLKYWRKINGMKQCLDFINKFNGKIPFEDQGTVNGVFEGKILILNPEFNFMNHFINMPANKIAIEYNVKNYYKNKEVKQANKSPVIIHFTAGYFLSPWFKNRNHPYVKIYQNIRKTLHGVI